MSHGEGRSPREMRRESLRAVDEARLAPHYELHVSRTGNLDELMIKVEGAPDADDAGAARDLAYRIKENIGVSATVRIVPPMSIERSQGKAKRVFDTRPR